MLRVFGGGAGGGVTTYVALTDAATADLPTVNAPLAAALALKLEANPPANITGSVNITKAAHANRRLGCNSATPFSLTFDGSSAFTTDDGFRIIQEGAGAITLVASGVTFTNPKALSLVTTGVGTWIDAEWDATIGQLVITAVSVGAASGTGNVQAILGGTSVAVAATTSNQKSKSFTIPAGTIGKNGAARITFANAKTGAVEAVTFSVRMGAVGTAFGSMINVGNNNSGTAVGTFVGEALLYGNGVDTTTLLAAPPGGSITFTTNNPVAITTLALDHGSNAIEVCIGGNGGATTGTWIVTNAQCVVMPGA